MCIVNPFEHGGGAEYQIELLIEALVDCGRYEVHYLTHFPDQRDRSRRYRVWRIGEGPIPRLGYMSDARALYRTLRQLKPCEIYQRVACAYTGICAAYAQRHGSTLLWHVAHDTDVTPQMLDPGRNLARVRLEKCAINFGARRAGMIVVQTEHQAGLLLRNFARTAAAVVPNFHPPAREALDKSGPFIVMWIANLKPWKRPEIFVRLAAQFADRGDVRFIMVGAAAAGGGNRQWQASLLRSIEAAPNLEYLGQRTHAQVNELLARAHLFVNTSTQEGFPNTFIQSWMRGVAVLSVDVDPDEVLARGGLGVIAGSETALAAEVRRLIEDPALRERYAARGRSHAAARHSLDNIGTLLGLIDGGCRGAG